MYTGLKTEHAQNETVLKGYLTGKSNDLSDLQLVSLISTGGAIKILTCRTLAMNAYIPSCAPINMYIP